jgi:periplasmic protein TonB
MSGDTVFLLDEDLPGPRPRRASPLQRLAQATPLQLALLASVALHLLLLTVQLATPGSAPRRWVEDKLEVILVNARDSEKPTTPRALAQASLRGGGEGALGERATSPLLVSDALQIGEAAEDAHRRLQALQVERQQLLSSLRHDLARLPPPDPANEAASPEGRALAERRKLLLTQMAELERRVNEHNEAPRARYVSPATQEVAYARYYDQLRRRVEQRGTLDFPTLSGAKLYGQLTMMIHVDTEGQVLKTEIVEPSGTAGLDARAEAIVRAAAPFGRFSKAMRDEAELLVLSARFTFDRDKGVQAELQGSAS